MRISPVLLLLPILVLSGSAAIANDDRPVSPQPAIASPVPAPLTIESLAGTYKGTVDEQWLIKAQETLKKDGRDWASFEISLRQFFEVQWIKINADGTYEAHNVATSDLTDYGKVRLKGSELIFTTELIKIDNSANVTKCPKNCTSLYLYVTADGKTLLPYDPQDHSSEKPVPFFRGYVKQ